jgi:hypothetical protein
MENLLQPKEASEISTHRWTKVEATIQQVTLAGLLTMPKYKKAFFLKMNTWPLHNYCYNRHPQT